MPVNLDGVSAATAVTVSVGSDSGSVVYTNTRDPAWGHSLNWPVVTATTTGTCSLTLLDTNLPWTQSWIHVTDPGDPLAWRPFRPEQPKEFTVFVKKLDPRQRRARDLLLAHLSERQRATFLSRGYFDVVLKNKRRYRVWYGTYANIVRLNRQGTPMGRYCIHIQSKYNCPVEDSMLAQKFMLEHDEPLVLRTARRHRVPARGDLPPGPLNLLPIVKDDGRSS